MPGMIFMPADWFFFDVRFGGFGIEYDYSVTKDDDHKHTASHFRIGGNLNELFFGNTAVGAHFVF
jgi:hypothetical protein